MSAPHIRLMKRMLAPLTVFLLTALLACSSPRLQPPGELDDLFSQLRTTASAEEAHHLELAILNQWGRSGRPEIDALLLRGIEMAHTGDLDGALSTLDQVVDLAPGFAEGYDQRALIHVMRDEYGEALLDLRRVLIIEPRHFSALAGLGRILLLYDKDEAALHAFEAALAINPYLDGVRTQVYRLRQRLAGTPI